MPRLKLCFLTLHSRHLMLVNTFAWQAVFISMWQTGVQDEDIALATTAAWLPPPLPQDSQSPIAPASLEYEADNC